MNDLIYVPESKYEWVFVDIHGAKKLRNKYDLWLEVQPFFDPGGFPRFTMRSKYRVETKLFEDIDGNEGVLFSVYTRYSYKDSFKEMQVILGEKRDYGIRDIRKEVVSMVMDKI